MRSLFHILVAAAATHGLVVVDLSGADLPTQMGCAIHAGFQAGRDAAAVVALRRAGAIVAGKAATTAYAIGPGGPTEWTKAWYPISGRMSVIESASISSTIIAIVFFG